MQALLGLALVAASVSAAPKVQVKLYSEALCPFCQEVLTGPVNQTCSAAGIYDAMDFEFVAWGNAFMKISECSDDQSYECWNKHCGLNARNPPADCWSGTPVCQHGEGECYGNLVENCVQNMTGNNAQKYMPFMYCFEGEGKSNKAALERCAPVVGLDAAKVTECQQGPLGKMLVGEAARKTANVKGRKGTPWIMINGKYLADDDDLLQEVCTEYTGPKPAGCP